MPVARALLERLEYPEPPDRRNLGSGLDEIRASIRRNLQTLLNSSHGGSQAAPDYGISAFADLHPSTATMRRLETEIQATINKYEPRLTDVQVSFRSEDEAGFELRFDIVATIVGDDWEQPAVFRSVIEPTGHIQIRRE